MDKRSLPGVKDWLLALATSALAATEFQTQASRARTQSATSYYFESPGVAAFHTAAIVLDVCLFLIPVLWLATPAKKLCHRALPAVAVIGFLLCWFEAVRATRLVTEVYDLSSLPFNPVNNFGLVGAQVFGSYLIFALPGSTGGKVAGTLVRIALAVCLWPVQMAVWSMVT